MASCTCSAGTTRTTRKPNRWNGLNAKSWPNSACPTPMRRNDLPMPRTTLFRRTRSAAVLLALSPFAAAAQAPATPGAAMPVPSALLECRSGYEGFMAYVPVLQDPLTAVALGWRPQPQTNPFMHEYRLNAPVTVFGRQSDHIAFA